jgi:phage head maturation protease
MERIASGAFARTIKVDRSRMRILFNHGTDPSIGNKPIAAVELLGEDPRGAFYGGYLFPVDYALQLVPALRAGQLGSSFRF